MKNLRIDIAQIDKEWLKGLLQECIYDGDRVVAIVGENREEGKHIVKCVNYHDALVTRVKELEEALDFTKSTMNQHCPNHPAVKYAEQALKKGEV